MAHPEEHRHRFDRVHGAVHGVSGHGKSAVVHQRERWPRHRLPLSDLRRPRALVHFRTDLPHQEAHGQMDSLLIDAVLRAVHRFAILPQVLYPRTGRGASWSRRRANVGRQSHVSYASRRCLRQNNRPACRRHRRAVFRILLSGMANR